MKFLIQKINGRIVHDFSFVLLESIRYHKWLYGKSSIMYRFLNTKHDNTKFEFKFIHRNYTPVGSVEFVMAFIKNFYNKTPLPLNVPECLFRYAGRNIINGTEKNVIGLKFIKSNDGIKVKKENGDDLTGIYDGSTDTIPSGNYQISDNVEIISEYRCFVFQNKLEGIHNYSGDFTIFPDVNTINAMIKTFSKSSPIAYTLDIGVNNNGTFVIEVHDFFSCGLYGFARHDIYPKMLYRWFRNYITNTKYLEIWS